MEVSGDDADEVVGGEDGVGSCEGGWGTGGGGGFGLREGVLVEWVHAGTC
jgi:hypothetical protein